MVFGDAYKPRFSGQGCWRFTTDKPPEMDYSATFYGPNKAGLIPLTQTSMYMYITTTEPGNPWMPDDQSTRVDARSPARSYGICC